MPTPSTPEPLARLEQVTLGARLVDLSLTIRAGERIAIVGPNGAGKSSLLRLLLGLERPDSGAVRLGDRLVNDLSARERARLVSWLPQRLTIPVHFRALDITSAAPLARGESPAKAEQIARSALSEQGASDLAERYADSLSGGELQRVLLAAVLAQDTPLILVDEPANHLDPFHQLATYSYLRTLKSRGKTLVVVTHDVSLLSELGELGETRVLGLSSGKCWIDTSADDPELPARLSDLFRVEIRRDEDGHLSFTRRARAK
jgi:iron complex transport system ATP-binding protein